MAAGVRLAIIAVLILTFRYQVLSWTVGAYNACWKVATGSHSNDYGCLRYLARLRLPGARMLARLGEEHMLGKAREPAMLDPLLSLYRTDHRPHVRAAALRGLSTFWDNRILQAFEHGLNDPDRSVRRAAILGIKELGDERYLPALAEAEQRETDEALKELLAQAPESLIPTPGPPTGGRPGETVKVAAIQFISKLNAPEANRDRLEGFVREAAQNGAELIVLPETAITGYMSVDLKTTWQLAGWDVTKGLRGISPKTAAEEVDGPSTQTFSRLAGELGVYLTIPFLEFDPGSGKYFNTIVLADPEGKALLHYRKLNPWPFAERGWASEGDRGHQYIDTPCGRLGLLICYDINRQPPSLKEKGVDTLLYCIAWVDREKSTWFHAELPRIAKRNDLNIIGANWTVPKKPKWHGYGQSLIIERTGRVLARATSDIGEEITYAELPVPEKL